MATKFLADQLGHPSGAFGRRLLAPLWNARNRALNNVAFDRLALCPGDRVLEVGFGGGYLLGRMLAVLSAGFLAGVDASPAMVARCARRYRAFIRDGRLELRCADVADLPYPSASFSKACTVNSIFYWQAAPRAISELWRVLAEDGTLVLCFTCKECLSAKVFTRPGVTAYEAADVQRMLAAAGFCDIDLAPHADRHREFWCIAARKPVGEGL